MPDAAGDQGVCKRFFRFPRGVDRTSGHQMISAKNLSEEQVTAIRQWAEDGSQLADIQKRLKGQFGLNVTYMDTRFVVLDLGIDIEAEGSEEDTEPPAEPVEAEVQVAEDESEVEQEVEILDPAAEGGESSGSVQVSADDVPRPGAIVSGSVTFSDGEKAIWMIDEYGRPGLDPETPGYQPTDADLTEFEKYLRALLEG